MSEILNEALLSQIKRLKALDLEKLNDLQAEATISLKSLKNESAELKEATASISQLLEKLPEKITIEEKRNLTIDVTDKGMAVMLIVTIISVIVAVGSFWYAKEQKATAKRSVSTKEWADFGKYSFFYLKEHKKGKLADNLVNQYNNEKNTKNVPYIYGEDAWY